MFINSIFLRILAILGHTGESFSTGALNDFLEVSTDVLNVFSWVNLIVPVDVVLVLLSLTALYYIYRVAIVVLRNVMGFLK
jgi:hypothetical protein